MSNVVPLKRQYAFDIDRAPHGSYTVALKVGGKVQASDYLMMFPEFLTLFRLQLLRKNLIRQYEKKLSVDRKLKLLQAKLNG